MDLNQLQDLYKVSTPSREPAYNRVKHLIGGRIADGTWTEGDRLPSENDLVTALGLSRMTIHRAFREMAAAGQIERIPGLGTFVANRKASTPLFSVHNIADEITRRGHQFQARVEFLREENLPSEHRMAVQFGRDDLFHSLIVHFEDELPIQLEDRWVNPAAAPAYILQDFTRTTPNAYLSSIAPLSRGEHVVEAVMPSEEERRLLQMPQNEPCLMIHRITYSGETMVTCVRLLLPGTRSRLEGNFDS